MGNKYIITYKEGATKDEVDGLARSFEEKGGKIVQRLDSVGSFTVEFPEASTQNFQNFQNDPLVEAIEADGVVTTQ